jgi:hypothetical protein
MAGGWPLSGSGQHVVITMTAEATEKNICVSRLPARGITNRLFSSQRLGRAQAAPQ